MDVSDTSLPKSDVRWFYQDNTGKRWLPFFGFDSINLEEKYRQLNKNSLSDIQPNVLNELGSIHSTQLLSNQTKSSVKALNTRVSVRGGLYEVDIDQMCCVPVYWSGGKNFIRVIRGTWFREAYGGVLEPLEDESMTESLEIAFIDCFRKSTITQDSQNPGKFSPESLTVHPKKCDVDKSSVLHSVASAPSLQSVVEKADKGKLHNDDLDPGSDPENIQTDSFSKIGEVSSPLLSTIDHKKRVVCLTVRFRDCHVDWYSENEAYLYHESTSLYIRQKLGMQKVGTRLFRGYNQKASEEDKLPDISHLCFVIHGIGQKMGISTIFKSCNDLRDTCDKLRIRYFSHLDEENKRVEFLPVEWRSSLQLDGDTVESITPVHIRGLRTTLNSSAMDIMYYTSPLYRAEISSCLQSELNRLYGLFLQLNPNFESRGGKVSLIAHSLGCVLVYDLITGWSQPLANALNNTSCETQRVYANQEFHNSNQGGNQNPLNSVIDGEISNSQINNDNYQYVNSNNLGQVARINLLLEAARAAVSHYEQERNNLLAISRDNATLSSAIKLNESTEHNGLAQPQSVRSISSGISSSLFTSNSLLFGHNLENLFCLGSPLGVYLVLRGIRPGAYQNQDSILPRRLCPRIFNIYHPADPVAYRLEPLILKHYTSIQPALIHRSDAVCKPWYDDLPLVYYSGKETKHHKLKDCYRPLVDITGSNIHHISDSNLISASQKGDKFSPQDNYDTSNRRYSITSKLFGFFTRTQPSRPNSPVQDDNKIVADQLSDSVDNSFIVEDSCEQLISDLNESVQINHLSKNNDLLMINSPTVSDNITVTTSQDSAQSMTDLHSDNVNELLKLDNRLDFELRASRYENMYISILTSHTSYWTNSDIGMLIMTRLFPPRPDSNLKANS